MKFVQENASDVSCVVLALGTVLQNTDDLEVKLLKYGNEEKLRTGKERWDESTKRRERRIGTNGIEGGEKSYMHDVY